MVEHVGGTLVQQCKIHKVWKQNFGAGFGSVYIVKMEYWYWSSVSELSRWRSKRVDVAGTC